MDNTSSNTVSRRLHYRVILFVSLVICLFSLNTLAEDTLQKKQRMVTVTVGKYVSVDLQHASNGSHLDGIEMGPLSWENGVLYVGYEGNKSPATDYPAGVQANAKIVVLTNTAATLQVSQKVPLSRGSTPSPTDPTVLIAPNSVDPGGSITKDGGSADNLWWYYSVKAPGAAGVILEPGEVDGPLRSATLTLTLQLTGWSLATPAGVYSGTLSVSIAAK